jgi:hypothetical protein
VATPASTPYTLPGRPASDPAAVVTGFIMAALGAAGLATKWGLTADIVLAIVGGVMTIAAAVRAAYHRKLQATQAAVGAPVPYMADDKTPVTDPEPRP